MALQSFNATFTTTFQTNTLELLNTTQHDAPHVMVEGKHPFFALGELLYKVASYVYYKLPSVPFAAAQSANPLGGLGNFTIEDLTDCEITDRVWLENLSRFVYTVHCFSVGETLPPTEINEAIHEIYSNNSLDEKEINKMERETLGKLEPGNIITVDLNGKPVVTTPDNERKFTQGFDTGTVQTYRDMAAKTGGIMGLYNGPETLTPVAKNVFDHILSSAKSDDRIDITLLLDTTESMLKDIDEVKTNLINFISDIQKNEFGGIRVAVVEFRDSSSGFVNRIDTDFTSNLDSVKKILENISTGGGRDIPEAVLDALDITRGLSWDEKAKQKVTIVIGDAPPHPTTLDMKRSIGDVVHDFASGGIKITIYPLLRK